MLAQASHPPTSNLLPTLMAMISTSARAYETNPRIRIRTPGREVMVAMLTTATLMTMMMTDDPDA
eukprot:6989117-Pyramimonas_sp.AAC.1